MATFDPLLDRISILKKLSPRNLKKLAGQSLSDVVRTSIPRSRKRVHALQERYPSSNPRELSQRLTDGKKDIAGMVGGVSGIFGLVSLPADLLVMSWLQIELLVDIATVYKINLKSERARKELLDLFGYANGIRPFTRAGPKVLGKVAAVLLHRGGLPTLGRAIPLVAAPVTAYLNNQHIQAVGDQALRYYQGFGKAHAKAKARAGAVE